MLLLMVLWLVVKINSSTSLLCLLLGISILIVLQYPPIMRHIKYLGVYCLGFGSILILGYSVPGLIDKIAQVMGRESTLTGRTEIWSDLLKEPVNQFIGTGYQSFWLGAGAVRMWEKYYFHPVQAHNGFLETYLNGGLIGVSLLVTTIIFTGYKLRKEMLQGSSIGVLLFSYFIASLFYNWTEALFGGLNLVWIILTVAALYYPVDRMVVPEVSRRGVQGFARGVLNRISARIPV
jgi:exopolysaccharide production protein ExoQ